MQFPVRLVARRTPGCMMWLSPVLALGLTVLFGAILFAMLGPTQCALCVLDRSA